MTPRTVAAAALVTLASTALAAQAAPDGVDVRYLAGTIGTHTVFASLELDGGQVGGTYAYGQIPSAYADALTLQGSLAPDGALEIDEYAQGEVGGRMVPYVSGHFSGRLDASRTHLTGSWTPANRPRGSDGKPLAVDLTTFARKIALAHGADPGRRIAALEFVDPRSELARFADGAVRADADRVLADSKRAPCCEYAPTFWSERIVSVVHVGSERFETFHEGLVFASRAGKPVRLAIGDILKLEDRAWPAELEAIVKKLPHAPLECPHRLNGFVITGKGALRIFVGCQPGTGDATEVDLPIPPHDLARLLRPDGPAASVLQARVKR